MNTTSLSNVPEMQTCYFEDEAKMWVLGPRKIEEHRLNSPESALKLVNHLLGTPMPSRNEIRRLLYLASKKYGYSVH